MLFEVINSTIKEMINYLGWSVTSLCFIKSITDANNIMLLIISVLTIGFFGLKYYEKILSIKKLKKEMKKEKNDNTL